MTLQVLKRLRQSRRVKGGSAAAIATLALLGSGLAASTAPAASVEAPAAVPTVKQSSTMSEKPTARRDCRTPYCWGSIAVAAGDNRVGWAYNYMHKWRVKRAALNTCKSRSRYPRTCRVLVWRRNGCAAVAVKLRAGGSVSAWGAGHAYGVRRAKRLALNDCGYPRCYIRKWVCTARS
jgi:hypothetical protein